MTRTEKLRAAIQKNLDAGVEDRAAIMASLPQDVKDLYDTPASLTGAVNAMHGNMLRKARAAEATTAVSANTPEASSIAQDKVSEMRDTVDTLRAAVNSDESDAEQVRSEPSELARLADRLTQIEARLTALEGKPAENLWQQGLNDAKRFADALHTRVRNTVLPKTLR